MKWTRQPGGADAALKTAAYETAAQLLVSLIDVAPADALQTLVEIDHRDADVLALLQLFRICAGAAVDELLPGLSEPPVRGPGDCQDG